MFQFFGLEAYGILTLPPGIEPTGPEHWKLSLNHWTAKKVSLMVFTTRY